MLPDDRPANGQPVVSVIMIFLNAERFIQEAIESVLAQTDDRFELLLVDDGSTDASTAIARRYAEQIPEKVRYLEHPGHVNRGTGASRNLGIQHARGEYVAFLDADDVWLPHALEHQLAIARNWPAAGMIYGATLNWYSWTGDPADARRDRLDFRNGRGVPPATLVNPPDLLLQFLQDTGSVPCMCSLLVRRELIGQIGAFDERFNGLHEDQAFYAKVALQAPVYVTGGYWAKYRKHPDSVCAVSARTGRVAASHLFYLSWLEQYLTQRQITDPRLWSALRRQRWQFEHPALHQLRQALRDPKEFKRTARRAARRVVPRNARRWLRLRARPYRRAAIRVGGVDFGSLRRTTPVDRAFGFARGQPVDRYYIERFLERHRADVRGRVLEVGDNSYTRRYGGERVAVSDVLHVSEGNPGATIVADLARADHIPSDSFDCIILTQTLHLIYDVRAGVRTLYRILKPGGVLLATFPGISQLSNDEWAESWYWSFTSRSARRLFGEVFPADSIAVEVRGNVLAATAFLYGLAAHELTPAELDVADPQYDLLIAVRAVKPGASR